MENNTWMYDLTKKHLAIVEKKLEEARRHSKDGRSAEISKLFMQRNALRTRRHAECLRICG